MTSRHTQLTTQWPLCAVRGGTRAARAHLLGDRGLLLLQGGLLVNVPLDCGPQPPGRVPVSLQMAKMNLALLDHLQASVQSCSSKSLRGPGSALEDTDV